VTCALVVLVAGWTPGTVGLLVGALTLLIATARRDRPFRHDGEP
jgi:hypothetical protein